MLVSEGRHGLWCTTQGLGEFGLPELQTIDVPPAIGVAWAGVLTGIALRIMERWLVVIRDPSVAFAELPALIELTRSDVARAYGQENDGGGTPARVQLRIDPAPDLTSDSFLTVGPPDGAQGPAAQYLIQVCAELFGPLPPLNGDE